ncbi:unnamed protein product [Prorocentrum cordatum]|uniref:Uncharacterized protein n=1 Tax=Prorocentrum cordatum TaxID=2364126 RepID=A0ABN9QDE9_9DINO|nr:unnamed protein product [Polarella glacialis]
MPTKMPTAKTALSRCRQLSRSHAGDAPAWSAATAAFATASFQAAAGTSAPKAAQSALSSGTVRELSCSSTCSQSRTSLSTSAFVSPPAAVIFDWSETRSQS